MGVIDNMKAHPAIILTLIILLFGAIAIFLWANDAAYIPASAADVTGTYSLNVFPTSGSGIYGTPALQTHGNIGIAEVSKNSPIFPVLTNERRAYVITEYKRTPHDDHGGKYVEVSSVGIWGMLVSGDKDADPDTYTLIQGDPTAQDVANCIAKEGTGDACDIKAIKNINYPEAQAANDADGTPFPWGADPLRTMKYGQITIYTLTTGHTATIPARDYPPRDTQKDVPIGRTIEDGTYALFVLTPDDLREIPL